MSSRTLTVHRVLATVGTVLALTFITSLLGFVLFGIILVLISINLIFSNTYEKNLPSQRHVKHVKELRTNLQANKLAVIGGALVLGSIFGLVLFGMRSFIGS